MTVHPVNLSNPMMMKGPLREFLPLPPQQVTVRLPEGKTGRAVKPGERPGAPRATD